MVQRAQFLHKLTAEVDVIYVSDFAGMQNIKILMEYSTQILKERQCNMY